MRLLALPLALALAASCSKRSEPDRADPGSAEPPAEPAAGAEEPQMVDLYGDPLPDGALARLGSVRMLDRALGRLIFSADGSEIITSSEDAYLIWQTTTAQRIDSLVLENAAHAMAISPDGKVLATAIHGGAIQLWSYPDREATGRIEGHRSDVTDLCFAGDELLVSGSTDRTVKLWKRGDKMEEKATLRGDWEQITSVACSASGPVVLGDDQGAVFVAATRGEVSEPVKMGTADDAVLDVAVSPDGTYVAAGIADGTARVWRATEPGRAIVIEAHPRKVLSVAFTGEGRLMTSGGDRFFRLWDPASGEKVGEREAAADVDAQLFELSGDGAFVAAYSELRDGRASEAGRFWLYDGESGKQLLEPERHQGPLTAIAFAARGEQVVTASEDHTVKLWDAGSSSLTSTLATHKDAVRDLVVRGDRVFSAGDDARMHVASLNGGDTVILEPIGGAVHAFAVSPDGDRIVTGDFVGQVWSFSRQSGKKIARHGGEAFEQVHDLAFSPDGKHFAIAGAGKSVHVVSVTRGETLTKLSAGDARSHHALAFSPDGKLLAVGSDDHAVRLWSTADWTLARTLESHDGTVRAVAFSADGKRLASASSDQSARVWNVASGAELTLLVGHRGAVTDVAFSPDGKRLATASRDETGLIWELPESEGGASEETEAKAVDAGAAKAAADAGAGKEAEAAADAGGE